MWASGIDVASFSARSATATQQRRPAVVSVKFCKIHRVHSVSHDACHNMVGLIMPISLLKMVGWDCWYGVGGKPFFWGRVVKF